MKVKRSYIILGAMDAAKNQDILHFLNRQKQKNVNQNKKSKPKTMIGG